ncbi:MULTISPECIES: uroporphyrinogen-III synthase [Halomonas]|uniref:Uroporphyrinogen-III synthase n=1 Tax=Halomonas halophila TaxID=29573 RepID=A0ABQ0U5J9_9GAMM|nr:MULTISPECIES: uroporphyrinogen-III synthase [Halomonas]MDR5889300.1 uroporphyrinogen-III synthase [Halomonas salina]RAH37236.1 uroporphyrinogen-III synthase [Halomonas sp. SL1]WJY07146.1 uroporphyrinogen-III synthase [Halomonas halophila]GEK73700.1 uroporphyrinogen-III synthase [Halomonas halophila]
MASAPVLICRPGPRAAALAEAIASRGFAVEHGEAMALEALPETAEQRAAWLDFDQFRRVVVVSPFAAECLAEALDRYWPQLPVGIDYYAVGAATAEVLHRELGVRVHVPPAGGGDTSEALLGLGSLARLDEQKVLLAAGEGGRALLGETLAERGGRLTRLALYRRRLLDPDAAFAGRLATGDYRALVVTSGEILEHLARWCSRAALHQPLIVSSTRLATLAGTLGFRRPVVAAGATPATLAKAVAEADPERADVDHDDLEKG